MSDFKKWTIEEIEETIGEVEITGYCVWFDDETGFTMEDGDIAHQIVNDHNEVAKLRAENERLRKHLTWIPVSERLPEVGQPVLCYSKEYGLVVDRLERLSPSDGGGVEFSVCYIHNYTHWLPRPSLPEED